MRLPLLDQLVALERGEAFVVAHTIGRYLEEVISRPQYQQRMYWQEALALAPLEQLRRRLQRRHEAEQLRVPRRGKSPKPSLVRVPFAELVALRESSTQLQSLIASEELAVVLGKFHQKSYNLDRYVRFSQ